MAPDGMLEVRAHGIHLAERSAHVWTTCARDAPPAYMKELGGWRLMPHGNMKDSGDGGGWYGAKAPPWLR